MIVNFPVKLIRFDLQTFPSNPKLTDYHHTIIDCLVITFQIDQANQNSEIHTN